jgi:Dolichyl-phosphate-mannose-protein mannosyltransferase
MTTTTTYSPPRRIRASRRARSEEPFPIGRRARPLPVKRSLRRGPALAIVGALMVAALGLRLAIPRGLWLDEAISVEQAQLSLPQLIDQLAHGDRHPPLHYVVLWATTRLFGNSDLAVRMPSIAAGVLLVPVVYALGRELYNRRTGVAAALLATVTPILVWYSQEARGYALETLFATLAVLGCVRALRYGRARDWALHAVAAALAVWTHWFAIFLVAATELVILSAVLERRRKHIEVRPLLVGWGLSSVALLCQLAPLALLASEQARATGTSGGYAGAVAGDAGGVSFYTATSNIWWAVFGFHPDAVTSVLSAVWPLLMLASLLMLGRGMSRAAAVLLACSLGPVLALLLLGIGNSQVFDVRYFLVAVPPFLVLLARLATSWPKSARGRVLAVGGIAALLSIGLADQQLDANNPRRYDFREALAESRTHPGEVLLYEPKELRYVLDRYAPNVTARPLDGVLPTRAQAPRVEVLTSFADQPRYRQAIDRQVGALRATRKLQSRESLPGVSLWRFR